MKKALQERDPVCDMMVDVDKMAIRTTHQGTDYYFCATGCRDQFLADPSRYVSKTEAAASVHTKWGGIVTPRYGSAGSGGAEYEPGPSRKN